MDPERNANGSLAADAGVVGAGVGLAVAARLAVGGGGTPVGIAGVLVGALAVAVFLARRYGAVDRTAGALVAGLASAGLVAYGLFAASDAAPTDPPVLLLVAIAAGGVVAAVAAVADWRATPDDRLVSLATVTGAYAALGLFGLFVISLWYAVLANAALVAYWSELTPVRSTVLSSVALGLGTATVALGYLSVTDRDRSFIDVGWPSLRDVGFAVGGVAGLFGVLVLASYAFQLLGAPSSSHSIVEMAEGNPDILLVLIPASLLVIGPGEELLFRNVVQKSLYDAFSRRAAVVVASAIFAAAHFSAYGSPSLLGTLQSLFLVFLLGSVLGLLYERTDNVLVPAFVHGTYNAILFASLYLDNTGGAAGFL